MNDKQEKLKIVFICASLQPGVDGVGDYSRRLAAALIRTGHECQLLSLNDHKIDQLHEGLQHADNTDIQVLRLPASMPINQRFKLARAWVNNFNPQWLSLQYVPFGYHPKGLKTGLSKLLLQLSAGRKWHIMFHEMWVGMAQEESIKLKIWGKAQQQLILSLADNLKPVVIHTQTHLYQALLSKAGYTAQYLPLFGNIPVVNTAQRAHIASANRIMFVVFGTIHDKAPIEAFAKEASAYAEKNNKEVSLTIIGRGNPEQQRWANAWKAADLPVEVPGELPAGKISEVLSKASIGLSATALAVISKSGTFAAMREHGLPVISVSKAWTPVGVTKPAIPEGVVEYKPGNFDECIVNSEIVAHNNSVETVSATFAEALQNYNPA